MPKTKKIKEPQTVVVTGCFQTETLLYSEMTEYL